MRILRNVLILLVAAGVLLVGGVVYLARYAEQSKVPEAQEYGPHPVLPPPVQQILPTIHFAKAVGWPDGGKPRAAPGLGVEAFADHLAHPRWLYVLPNGDVLVAETSSPSKPDDTKGIRGAVAWIL